MVKKKAYNIILILGLMLAFFFSESLPAKATPKEDFTIDLSYGYRNYQKEGRDMPIWIHAHNNGSSFSGEMTLTINSGIFEGMSFSQHVSLIADSSDEYVIYIPCIAPYTSITIDFKDNLSDRVYTFSKKTLNLNTSDIYLGILSDAPESIAPLTDHMLLSSPIDSSYSAVRVINLNEHHLPDSAEGYHGFDIIVANHFDSSYMTDEQFHALRTWIEEGGILYTGCSTDMNAFLKKLNLTFNTPVKQETIETDFNTSFETYVYLDTPLTWEELNKNPSQEEIDNSDTIISSLNPAHIRSEILPEISPVTLDIDIIQTSCDNNVINTRNYQRVNVQNGFVLISKFDFMSKEFLEYTSAPFVFQKIILNSITQNDWAHFFSFSDNYRSVWESQSLLLNTLYETMPGYTRYAIILIVYIIIIGPLSYIILKKLDKRYLMWTVVPIITITFTGIIFAVSSGTRHISPFINYASFINYHDNGSVSEQTYYSTTLPDKGKYTRHIDQSYTVHAIDNSYFGSSFLWEQFFHDYPEINNNNRGLTYAKNPSGGTDIIIDNTSLFSTRYFSITDSNTQIEAIETDLSYRDGHYSGIIHNNTPYDLKNLCVIISGNVYGVGNIAAHSQLHIDINMDINTYLKDADADKTLENEILQALNIPYSHKNDSDSQIKLNMFTKFINDTYKTGYPYIVGFIPGYLPENFMTSDIPVTGISMFQRKINIDYTSENGKFYIPDISHLMYVESGEIYNLSRDIFSSESTALYNFDNNLEINQITLELNENSDNLSIYLFNYDLGIYEPVFSVENRFIFEPSSPYIDDNNILRLKYIQNLPYTENSFSLPVISASGKVVKCSS